MAGPGGIPAAIGLRNLVFVSDSFVFELKLIQKITCKIISEVVGVLFLLFLCNCVCIVIIIITIYLISQEQLGKHKISIMICFKCPLHVHINVLCGQLGPRIFKTFTKYHYFASICVCCL